MTAPTPTARRPGRQPLNNANMQTPPDGGVAEMQMYLFDDPDADLDFAT